AMASREEPRCEPARATDHDQGLFCSLRLHRFFRQGPKSKFKGGSGLLLVGWGGVGGQDTP
ncbi:hypothetical protein, partial [Stenotrophomonas maltophilia]|uniref:hypothetical protein n=1 Tax=Stenotrophomonas maltophilia TaxID=40324 RepID=UPI00193AD696